MCQRVNMNSFSYTYDITAVINTINNDGDSCGSKGKMLL